MAVFTKYSNLSELDYFFCTGFIIIGDMLFHLDKGCVINSWDFSGRELDVKVNEANAIAILYGENNVVYDDVHMYNEEVVSDTGELLTVKELWKRMSPEDAEEYSNFSNFIDG